MGDIMLEREKKKRLLRKAVISTQPSESDGYEKKIRRHRRRRLLGVCIAVIGLVVLFLGWKEMTSRHLYKEYSVAWSNELAEGAESQYVEYLDNVVKYNRDGISYLDSAGQIIWTQTYEMKSPVVDVNGSYLVVADRNGNSMYICDKNGRVGEVSTILPILKASVAENGVTAAILEDDMSNYIYFYDMTGRQLDISTKTLLAGNGYPLDLSLSPNGKLLAVSYVYLNQGVLKTRVVFRNFGEEGQEEVNRLVGGFEDYEDSMVARIEFLSDTYACAFAQDRICFYSLRQKRQAQEVQRYDFVQEIKSIFYSSEYVGVITDSEDGAAGYVVHVYKQDGSQMAEIKTELAYTQASFSGGHLLLFNDSICEVYNMSGHLKYQGSMGGTFDWITCLAVNRYLMMGNQSVKEIRLK